VKQKDGGGMMLKVEGGARENQEHNVNCGGDGVSIRRRESMDVKRKISFMTNFGPHCFLTIFVRLSLDTNSTRHTWI
jgi:hypothetical protein